jgi:aryl-alcohol dehydrogenase-like predicted oxidoreductase
LLILYEIVHKDYARGHDRRRGGGGVMQKRQLGGSGLTIAPLVFGGNIFGWTVDESTSFSLLDAFIAGGFNCIDTADVYSNFVPGNQGGESEATIGRWLHARGRRDDVVLATKVGNPMGGDRKGLSKRYITQAVEDSLTRLQTDYIDLYQAHRDDQSTPLEVTLEAFEALIKSGKVRAIGASNYTGARLGEALRLSSGHGLPRFHTLQPLYNLYDRANYEADLEPVCISGNLGVMTYFSLASGFLTGKYRSKDDLKKSKRGAFIESKLDARGLRILAALDEICAETQSTPTCVALAWLLARPSITAPIASATSLGQLDQLFASTRLELSAAAIGRLNNASAYT